MGPPSGTFRAPAEQQRAAALALRALVAHEHCTRVCSQQQRRTAHRINTRAHALGHLCHTAAAGPTGPTQARARDGAARGFKLRPTLTGWGFRLSRLRGRARIAHRRSIRRRARCTAAALHLSRLRRWRAAAMRHAAVLHRQRAERTRHAEAHLRDALERVAAHVVRRALAAAPVGELHFLVLCSATL